MNTNTLFSVIEMIDTRIKYLTKDLSSLIGEEKLMCLGAIKELSELSDHLQQGVEGSGPDF
jgi:hypothetical protein